MSIINRRKRLINTARTMIRRTTAWLFKSAAGGAGPLPAEFILKADDTLIQFNADDAELILKADDTLIIIGAE